VALSPAAPAVVHVVVSGRSLVEIIGIAGSLRRDSLNKAVLRAGSQRLVIEDADYKADGDFAVDLTGGAGSPAHHDGGSLAGKDSSP
jgi:hypothetical protein